MKNSAKILAKKITKEDFKEFMEKNKEEIIEEFCITLYNNLEEEINKTIEYKINKTIENILEKTLKNSLINSLNKKE